MTPQDFLLEVFCFVDDELQALTLGRLRARGPQPALADSEVIAIELVGEFWGLDTDKALFRHFRCYHRGEFPALAHVSRTTFARQAANLWWVGEQLRQRRDRCRTIGLPLFGEVVARALELNIAEQGPEGDRVAALAPELAAADLAAPVVREPASDLSLDNPLLSGCQQDLALG